METNYKVKHKRMLLPIKQLLLLTAMVLFGLSSFAQASKTVRAANDQQLLEAMENPSVHVIVLDAGYYAYADHYYEAGTKVIKGTHGNNEIDAQCTYTIQPLPQCFPIGATSVNDTATAGTIGGVGVTCPPDNSGKWTVASQPVGSTVNYQSDSTNYVLYFDVDTPGSYLMKYTWPSPWNTYAQTEYFFYGAPEIQNLSALPVCGLTTQVDFTYTSGYDDPYAVVSWTLNDVPVNLPAVQADIDNTFDLTVPSCGIYKLKVTVTPTRCDPVSDSIMVTFNCEPTANAGEDMEVCNDMCVSLVGSSGLGPDSQQPGYAVSWNMLSGPAGHALAFSNPTGDETDVCRDDLPCSYGWYEVTYEVVNGECTDKDTMNLYFDELPMADAGLDFSMCWTSGPVTLDAMPFDYCVTNYIPANRGGMWTAAAGNPGIVDFSDPTMYNSSFTPVDIPLVDAPNCLYGVYKFYWTETNGSCTNTDSVLVTLYEQPVANAGENQAYCYYEGDINLEAIPYAYCTDGNPSHHWIQLSGPEATINSPSEYITTVTPIDPDCIFGTYEFRFYEINGDCIDSSDVSVRLDEPPTAIAGADQTLCYSDGPISIMATPFVYCSDANGITRTGAWSLTSGPANVNVTFDDAGNPETNFTPDGACVFGQYQLTWTETNGLCSDAASTMVTLYEQPMADAGEDMEFCMDKSFSMALMTTLYASPYSDLYCSAPVDQTRYGQWTKTCGPGLVEFTNVNDPGTIAHVDSYGCYCFVWTEYNGDCNASDTVHVCFYEHPWVDMDPGYYSACGVALPADIPLSSLGAMAYTYLGGTNVNYGATKWEIVESPLGSNPTISDSTVNATLTTDMYGHYVLNFIEMNGMESCADTVQGVIDLFQQPVADAGADESVCDYCYTLQAMPFVYDQGAVAANQTAYWSFFEGPNGAPPPTISDPNDPNASACITDDWVGSYYGAYTYVWTEVNGTCEDSDTVTITYNKMPDPFCITYQSYSDCYQYFNIARNFDYGGTICPDSLFYTCAGACTNFYVPSEALVQGWTYEWTVLGPNGTTINAQPGYYEEGFGWHYPSLEVCWGECCDTAYIYLTITTPQGCVNTVTYKAFVHHKPDVTLTGPDVTEVGSTFTYCVPENPCGLYTWEVQQCGHIVGNGGGNCVDVEWTTVGQGLVHVWVLDTCTGCCNEAEMTVNVLPTGSLGDASLSGHVYYDRMSTDVPLNGVKVTLWNAGVPVFETYTFNDVEGGNGLGYYDFNGINGLTNFGVTAEFTGPWYGANATDALAIQLDAVGSTPGFWDALSEEAADVNASGGNNATDALWVMQRAVALVTYFPAGDWAFLPGMSTTAGTYDILTLNYGDVNKSNNPPSTKDMPAIDLVYDGTMNVVAGQEFELPIRVAKPMELGAVTLNLNYNANLIQVVDVNQISGMVTNLSNGMVSVAWSSLNPMSLNDNDAILVLKVKALGEVNASQDLFSISNGSELADAHANVYTDVKLKAFGITTDPVATDYFLSYNRPNPFNTNTQIEYTMPENGKVKLSVMDLLGQTISVLVDASQSAGSYTVDFNGSKLAPGVYIYKIVVQGETRDFIETRRMVISH